MAVNKVVFGGSTLVDLTDDTVNEQTLIQGVTAHNAAGVRITGTAVIPTKTSDLFNDVGFLTREFSDTSAGSFVFLSEPSDDSTLQLVNNFTISGERYPECVQKFVDIQENSDVYIAGQNNNGQPKIQIGLLAQQWGGYSISYSQFVYKTKNTYDNIDGVYTDDWGIINNCPNPIVILVSYQNLNQITDFSLSFRFKVDSDRFKEETYQRLTICGCNLNFTFDQGQNSWMIESPDMFLPFDADVWYIMTIDVHNNGNASSQYIDISYVRDDDELHIVNDLVQNYRYYNNTSFDNVGAQVQFSIINQTSVLVSCFIVDATSFKIESGGETIHSISEADFVYEVPWYYSYSDNTITLPNITQSNGITDGTQLKALLDCFGYSVSDTLALAPIPGYLYLRLENAEEPIDRLFVDLPVVDVVARQRASSAASSRLPLSGGTMTGSIGLKAYLDSDNGNTYSGLYMTGATAKGTNPTNNEWFTAFLAVEPKTYSKSSPPANANKFGQVEVAVQTDGSVRTSVQAYRNVANAIESTSLYINQPKDGNGFLSTNAPTLAKTDNSNKIPTTAYVKNVVADYVPLSGSSLPHFIRGSGSTAANTTSGSYAAALWKGTDSTITELYDGLIVYYRNDVAGHGTYGTLLQINNLDAKPVVVNVNTMIGTRFPTGCVIPLIYNATQTATAYNDNASTTYTGCWQMAEYDSTNVNSLRHNSFRANPLTAIYRYQVCFTTSAGRLLPANAVDNSTATNKTLTTTAFNPFAPIYYYAATSTVSANAVFSANSNFYLHHYIDLRYSFNSGTTLTIGSPVYIKCSKQNDGSVKLAGNSCITQSLPSSNDGYVYIYLGNAYTNYQVNMTSSHPVYYHNGTGIRLWTGG